MPGEKAVVVLLQSANKRTAAVRILLAQGLVVSATELAVIFEGKEDALVGPRSLLVIRV
jgi:hypothetical protein